MLLIDCIVCLSYVVLDCSVDLCVCVLYELLRASKMWPLHKFRLRKCCTPAGLGTFSLSWGLPALGCPCKALPNIEKVPRPTGAWQKGTLELIILSDKTPCYLLPVCEKTFLILEPLPCNLAAETPLRPLIWYSEGISSQGISSPEECFCHKHRYHVI